MPTFLTLVKPTTTATTATAATAAMATAGAAAMSTAGATTTTVANVYSDKDFVCSVSNKKPIVISKFVFLLLFLFQSVESPFRVNSNN